MSTRSLNKVQLIGNLTRDPELRFTPQGTAVCTFGMATNRAWTTEAGEKREEAEFHRIVAWNKLAELCSQLLTKGRKVYVEGRLQTRNWNASDGTQHTTTEVVIEDMIILDPKRVAEGIPVATSDDATAQVPADDQKVAPVQTQPVAADDKKEDDKKNKDKKEEEKTESTNNSEDINPDDIPF